MLGRVFLNRYRVDQFLGRGGMAEVYKVWDKRRNTHLAMKLLHEELALDKVFIRRFKREARNLAQLQHPHIVRFYELVQDEFKAFILMDYVKGVTLKHHIFAASDQGMESAAVREVNRALCSALQFAHREGIIHCDLKPGNIIIDKNGQVMLTDFGIARLTDSATATMVGAGTPAYMAPEQIKGQYPTAQTDIYALGVLLFEMLTGGERPFTGQRATNTGSTSAKVRWEHINLPPPSPKIYNPGILPKLERVALKCLAKHPRERYKSALEFFNALELALPEEKNSKWDPESLKFDSGKFEQGGNKAGKRFPLGLLALAGLLVIGLGFLLLKYPNRRERMMEHEVDTAEVVIEGEVHPQKSPIPTINSSTYTPQIASLTPTFTPKTPTSNPPTFTPRVPTSTPYPSLTPNEDGDSSGLYTPLSGCAQSRVHVGDSVFVAQGGTGNYIRNSPNVSSDHNIISYVDQGGVLLVIDGPKCSYGWILWEVISEEGDRGWTAESDGDEFWLDIILTEQACPTALPTRLEKGDIAHVGVYPPNANVVRSQPDSDSSKVGTINPGERIEILDGYECGDGMVWWKIQSLKTGLEGWTSEGGSDYWLFPEL